MDEPRSEIRLFDVAAVFFFSLVTASVGILVGSAIGGEGSYAETCGSLIGLWGGLIPGTILISRVRATGSLDRDLGFSFKLPSDLKGVIAGLASQFILLPFIYVIVQAFVDRDLTADLEEPATDITGNAHGPGFFFLAVLLVVGAPLVEEIFYRGLLLQGPPKVPDRCRRHLGLRRCVRRRPFPAPPVPGPGRVWRRAGLAGAPVQASRPEYFRPRRLQRGDGCLPLERVSHD